MTRSLRTLVTGGSSGIGRGIAARFLADGARVILNGRNVEKLEQTGRELDAPRERLVVVAGDIADPATAERLVAAAKHHFGGLDVVVNSAGVFDVKPFLETPLSDLERYFQTNVKGTWMVTQAATPLLIEAGGGAIVNIGAAIADQAVGALPASAAMASKGGLHALTVSWAAELGAHDIRVNTIAPGIIRTPLIGDADPLAGHRPLTRVGEVEDTADAALFLATNGYVTGELLHVDGGFAHGR